LCLVKPRRKMSESTIFSIRHGLPQSGVGSATLAIHNWSGNVADFPIFLRLPWVLPRKRWILRDFLAGSTEPQRGQLRQVFENDLSVQRKVFLS
jgi:hypothetical protein